MTPLQHDTAWRQDEAPGGAASAAARAARALSARPYVALGLATALVVVLGIAVLHGLRRDPHDEYDGWDHFV